MLLIAAIASKEIVWRCKIHRIGLLSWLARELIIEDRRNSKQKSYSAHLPAEPPDFAKPHWSYCEKFW